MKNNKYIWKSLGYYRNECNNLVELKICKEKKEPKSDNSWMGVVAFISIIVNVILTIILINNL